MTEDRAIALESLKEEILQQGDTPQLLVGDGASLCRSQFSQWNVETLLPPPHLKLQCAWGVARAALELDRKGQTGTAAELVPQYHRLSQAERERAEMLKKKKGE